MEKQNIIEFLKELRDSAGRIHNIYTRGSCYRLYCILQKIFPEAQPYWSDIDGHAITKIGEDFYDIGGLLNKNYVEEKGYYLIPERLRNGYYLLKYEEEKDCKKSVVVEKYKDENNKEDTKT